MIELSSAELGIAWPLLRGFPHKQDFIHSVYEKKQQGTVFVDAKGRPTVAVLIHRGGNVVLAGDVQSPGVDEFLKAEFLSPLRDRPWAQLVPESETGERVIVGALGPKVTKVRRRSFLYGKNKSGAIAGWRRKLSSTQAVRRIDEDLLARIGPEYHDHILEDWDSAASFLEHGAGFWMVADGRIATVCYSVTCGKRIMPIQVDTREEYRMKGFAFATCAAFIEFCLGEGLQPRWECDVANVASLSLARKLGFVLDRELTVFRLQPSGGEVPAHP